LDQWPALLGSSTLLRRRQRPRRTPQPARLLASPRAPVPPPVGQVPEPPAGQSEI